MDKIFTKSIFLLSFLTLFAFKSAVAQTVTISPIDIGPYGQGSTIAVPFHINDATGCIPTNNTFTLYLCNATGTILSATAVASLTGFYGTCLNYTVPAGTPAGTYTFRVKTSSPAYTSVQSNTFTIVAGAGPSATVTSMLIGTGNFPEVFGNCSGTANSNYTFTNASTAGSTATISFFNELTQAAEASNKSITTFYQFNTAAANYTVTVKAVNAAGIVSTHAYQLINNVVNTSIGATGNPTECLAGGSAALTYNIDISSSTGIQYNYPGNTYTFNWGDGSPKSIYTLCQIKALNGQITHNFTATSCGLNPNNHANSFEIDFQGTNAYCGNIGSAPSNYAKILRQPKNNFSAPLSACTGTPVSFINTSDPGPDANANTSSCAANPNALFDWYVDGVLKQPGYRLSQNFVYTFTEGAHTVTLHLENPTCAVTDYTQPICIQDPPKPGFNLPVASTCIGSGPVSPINNSVIDIKCDPTVTYAWSVTPTTGVTFNAASATPQFAFSTPGVYIVALSVTTPACGTVAAPATHTIVVNQTPTAKLSADFAACGTGQTYSFSANPTNNPTYTQLAGTAQPQANTFTWNVTGGTFNYVGGTSANSQYPQIIFNDYAIYTITVTQQNNCGIIVSTPQHINFQKAPTVTASSNAATICAGASVTLQGTVGVGVTGYKWVGGTGTYTPNNTSLNTTYQPSAAEIAAGQVTLALQATTAEVAPCNIITTSVPTITITPYDAITGTLTKTTCSKQSVAYTITAQAAGSTFTWKASLVSGSATGFSATGNSATINDVITNTDPAASTNAVVAYVITPFNSNGCPGTPSTLNVTITPSPILTATVANNVICSGQSAGVSLSTALNGVTYIWTSTATGSATGNTQNSIPASTTSIQDILTNPGANTATVKYTITPYNSDGCPGAPVTATVTVQPQPIQSVAGNPISLCNTTSTPLSGNSPAPGTGLWTEVSGAPVNFTNAASPTTTVTGLAVGVYRFAWTITTGPNCTSTSTVTVTVNSPTIPGTTTATGPATVCSGTNSGQINLSGQLGQIVNWQSSVDNGTTWQPISPVNTTGTLTYSNLNQTTEFEAIVQNGSCGILTSTPTTITVNQQPTVVADAGLDQPLCGQTSVTLQGNNPGTYLGMWTQISGPQATIVDPTKYNTVVNGLLQGNTYVFQWAIMAVTPCQNSTDQVTIIDNADVIPAFTTDLTGTTVCGSKTVTFTNTSNNQTGAQFSWDFGDGSPISTQVSPQHVFQENPTGVDAKYTVSLSVLNNCVSRQPYSQDITIQPAKPTASIQLQNPSGCSSPYPITVLNTSPGNNNKYEYYLYLGTTQVDYKLATDKSNVTFNPITVTTPTQYKVYMVATSTCGSNTSAVIPITITPPTVFPNTFELNGVSSGCAPLSVTLVNNSTGGSGYHYNIYDNTGSIIAQPPAGPGNFPYTFTNPGTYYVSITASNNCSVTGVESSPKVIFTVYPEPVPGFLTNTDCNSNVTFSNTTQDNGATPASSLSYLWDFGDGTTSTNFSPPPHAYDYKKSPFTINLTVTNFNSGCSTVFTQSISVAAPLVAAFTEFPGGVATIPNYQFSFTDQSTGNPSSWSWAFGDGSTSILQNPVHRYADTGTYVVSLTVTNAKNCTSTITNKVSITGTPGQLFLPNAFIPTSATTELRTFMAKGSGIKNWVMQIFNNYGQLIWQTTRLDAKGSPVDGWDGTFKGAAMPQGSYTWQVSATFINGTQWKGMSYNGGLPQRTGSVNLIR